MRHCRSLLGVVMMRFICTHYRVVGGRKVVRHGFVKTAPLSAI